MDLVYLYGQRSPLQLRETEADQVQTIKAAPIEPIIPFDVLDQIDIRVGTIELVENVAGSDKLVRLTVDLGDHKRRILVGMKQERQNPREVEGRQALFVVKLAPKKMMGEVSQGLLLTSDMLMASPRYWRRPNPLSPTDFAPGRSYADRAAKVAA